MKNEKEIIVQEQYKTDICDLIINRLKKCVKNTRTR